MRIVIAGGGDIAFQFARELHTEQDIVVIEPSERAARFQSLDVQVIKGSSTSAKTLQAAQLSQDDAFVACSASDEQNLIACLAAKRLTGVRTFCFVSKEEYYESFQAEDEDGSLLGIDVIIWPQYMLAREVSRIVLVPDAIDVEVFAKGRVWLMEYRLDQDSSMVGIPLQHLSLPRQALAVARVRDDELHIPKGDTSFSVGDKVVFMGKRRALARLTSKFLHKEQRVVREVTIVGGGNVGLTLAKLLERGEGLRIKVIEVSTERCDQVASQLKHATVLHGDGTDLGLLQEEQINRSDVLVSVTSDDEKNLLCSLLARQMGIPKIVTRVNKPPNMKLFEGVGIDVPLNPRVTAISAVLNSLRGAGVQFLATLEHGQAHVVELVVPDDFPVTAVKNLPRQPGAIIGAILSGYKTRVPHGDDYVEPGDHLLVLCTEEAREAVQEYF